jgi:uncharacterized protein YndB with AHSA1/START domain
MIQERNVTVKKAEEEIVVTRIFEASRELVWKVWTEPEHIKHWWGSKDYTAPFCQIELRVGGVYLFCMRSPEGRDFWSTGIYREIVVPERIVCTDCFADEKGNIVPAMHYGLSTDFPLETLWTLTFEEHNNRTRFTLRHSGMPPGQLSKLANVGWNQSLDKFAETLKYSLPRR